MDEFTIRVLKDLDCENLIEMFKVQEIGKKLFLELTDDDLKDLFPTFGPRKTFKRKYEEFKENYNPDVVAQSNAKKPKTVPAQIEATLNDQVLYVYKGDDENVVEQYNISDLELVIENESSENQNTSSATVQEAGEPLRKKQKYDAELVEKVFIGGLEAYLESDRVRKQLLTQTVEMSPAGRSELVQIVVNYLHENYAINQHPGTKASGKLYARYYNQKRPFNNAASTSNDGNGTTSRQQQDVLDPILSTPNASFQYLRGELEITKEYIEHWHGSAELRKKLLQEEGIEKYFYELPALATSQGYKLLLEEFDHKYPKETLSLLNNWNDLASKIVLYCRQKELISEDHLSASTDFLVATYLPRLFQPVQVGRKSKKATQESRKILAQKHFFLQIPDAAALEPTLHDLKKQAKLRKSTVQPLLIGIVSGVHVRAVYVSVADVLYEMASIPRAIDVCFKVFVTLNAEFPEECRTTWSYLLHHVYGIATEYNKVFTTVEEFAVELRNIRQEPIAV